MVIGGHSKHLSVSVISREDGLRGGHRSNYTELIDYSCLYDALRQPLQINHYQLL